MRTALSFDDVLLVPQYSHIHSRDDVDLSTNIAGLPLNIPILSANMATVTEADMASALASAGGLGPIHRMCRIDEQAQMVRRARVGGLSTAFSFGIDSHWRHRVRACINAGASAAFLDVAHAAQSDVWKVISQYYAEDYSLPLVVGNVATPNEVGLLLYAVPFHKHESIAFKVGVGGGSNCSTRIMTGCGIPTFQSVLDIHKQFPTVSLIADGGIKSSGDIVKALAAGASAVMVGALLAGTEETPGQVIRGNDGELYKIYRGSASYGDKAARGSATEYIEGVERLVKYQGSVDDVLERLLEGVRSGFSYLGASSISKLRESVDGERVEFVRVTSAGYTESFPHGLL